MPETYPEEIALGRRGVVRVGGTVRRPSGSYPTPVLNLLRYLRTINPEWVPRERGVDEEGRQIFDWIEGQAGVEPVTCAMRSEAALEAIAKMLRRLHDATANFDKAATGWNELLADPSGSDEIVCHNDVSSHNIIFRDAQPFALVDWEFAHPGSRLWDVAYAVVWLVPLHPIERCEAGGWFDVDQAARLRLFCDAYGVGDERRYLLDIVEKRQERNAQQLKLWRQQGLIPPAEPGETLPQTTSSYIASQASNLRQSLIGPAPELL